jgi:hypothetical protein
MKIFCFDCGHRCHCKNQGYYVSTSQCSSCDCMICNHTNIKNIGENMVKKIIKWIWAVVSWPFKKIYKWLIG